VLALISTGSTNRDTARRLFISEATVKTHLVHLSTKLASPTGPPRVRAGFKQGLLSAEPPPPKA
jgi:DNA-binding NarL/FixJ family response regulator